MIKDNIQFEIPNEYGVKINCFLLGSITVNENEVNIIYKENNDEDDVLRYGKLLRTENDEFYLTKNISITELEELKNKFNEQLVSLFKDTICEWS